MSAAKGVPVSAETRRRVAGLNQVSDPKGLTGLLLVLLAILSSAGSFSLGGAGGILFYALGFCLAVWAQFACLELVHEGIHRLLLTSKRGNDWLAGLYASLIGMSLPLYRFRHLEHHRHFGFPEDPDYFAYADRPEGPAAWGRYFLANFSGLNALRTLLQPAPAAAEIRSPQHPLGTACLHLGLWAATALAVGPYWYPLFWLLPLLSVTFGSVRFRTFLEHWDEAEAAESPARGTIWNLGGFLQANLFAAPFGYNLHGWHHLFPAIPGYNLKKIEGLLAAEDAAIAPRAGRYLARIGQAMTAKGAGPRVMDSLEVTDSISKGGNLAFYLNVLRKDPKKILVGISDSLREVLRFLIHPRQPVGMTFRQRVTLVVRFASVEVKIPGATTLLETIWLIYAIASSRAASGAWVEVGCYKGLSTVRLSILADLYDRQLLVFDTFEGLPGSDAVYETVNGQPAYHFKAGSYKGSAAEVAGNLERFGVRERVKLIKGEVGGAHKGDVGTPVSFAFLDVDLVESYKGCFEMLAQGLAKGSVIVIAEAAFRPIRKLIEDAAFWRGIGCEKPAITYIEDRYHIRTCQNLAFLSW